MNTYRQNILRFDINNDYANIPLIHINEELILNYEVGNHQTLPNIKWFNLIWKLHYTNPNNNDELLGLLISHAHELIKDEISPSILINALSCSISNLRQRVENAISPTFLTFSQLYSIDISSFSKKITEALLAI